MSIVLSSSLFETSASSRVYVASDTIGCLASVVAVCIHPKGDAVEIGIDPLCDVDLQPDVDIAVPFTSAALRTLTLDSTQLHAELCTNLQLCLEVAQV